jgi:hypothetical protein
VCVHTVLVAAVQMQQVYQLCVYTGVYTAVLLNLVVELVVEVGVLDLHHRSKSYRHKTIPGRTAVLNLVQYSSTDPTVKV